MASQLANERDLEVLLGDFGFRNAVTLETYSHKLSFVFRELPLPAR